MLNQRGDGDDRHPLGASQQDVGLIGDAEVIPARSHGLQDSGGVGRRVGIERQPGLGKPALLLRQEDAGVIGIGVLVEGQGRSVVSLARVGVRKDSNAS